MTDLTTKELFELAKVWADSYDEIDTVEITPWGDLAPIEQAAVAEGVRAVVEELERRGWYPLVKAEPTDLVFETYTPTTSE